MHVSKLRRGSAVVSAVALTAFALGACSSDTDTDAGNSDSTLSVIFPSEPSSLNPTYLYTTQRRFTDQFYDPLVGLDRVEWVVDDSGLLPTWEQVDDLTWEFDVRQGVKFHDGSALTAADIVFSILNVRDEPKSGYALAFQDVTDVQAVDDSTVRVTTRLPDSDLPAKLTIARGLPAAHYQQVGGEAFGRDPIATGPFKLGEYKPGTSLTAERNDDYWGDVAKVEEISFTWSSDASARAQ